MKNCLLQTAHPEPPWGMTAHHSTHMLGILRYSWDDHSNIKRLLPQLPEQMRPAVVEHYYEKGDLWLINHKKQLHSNPCFRLGHCGLCCLGGLLQAWFYDSRFSTLKLWWATISMHGQHQRYVEMRQEKASKLMRKKINKIGKAYGSSPLLLRLQSTIVMAALETARL